jgi:hypothetical protein
VIDLDKIKNVWKRYMEKLLNEENIHLIGYERGYVVGAEKVQCRGVAAICRDGDVRRGKDGGQKR